MVIIILDIICFKSVTVPFSRHFKFFNKLRESVSRMYIKLHNLNFIYIFCTININEENDI